MTRERLEQIRNSKERARRYQEREFQSSGNPKSMSRMRSYEDMVDICDLALSKVDDHNAAGHMKADIIWLAQKADSIINRNGYDDLENVRSLLKETKSIGMKYGSFSRWD